MHRHALYIANYHPADANRDSGFDDESDGGRLCGTLAEAVHRIALDAWAHYVANRAVVREGADVDGVHAQRAIAYRKLYEAAQSYAVHVAGCGPITIANGITTTTTEPDALRVVARFRLPDHGDYTVSVLREGDPHPCTECGAAGRVTAIHSDRNGTQFGAFATCAVCLREWEATFGTHDGITPELRATLDAHNCPTCGLDAWTCAAHHGDAHSVGADTYGDPVAETDAFLDAPNR